MARSSDRREQWGPADLNIAGPQGPTILTRLAGSSDGTDSLGGTTVKEVIYKEHTSYYEKKTEARKKKSIPHCRLSASS